MGGGGGGWIRGFFVCASILEHILQNVVDQTLEKWGQAHLAINSGKCNSKDKGPYMQNVATPRLHLSNCEYFSGWESCTDQPTLKYCLFPCTRRIRITSGYEPARPCVQDAILKAPRADYGAAGRRAQLRNWEKQIPSRYSSLLARAPHIMCSAMAMVTHVNVCKTKRISTASHIHDMLFCHEAKYYGGQKCKTNVSLLWRPWWWWIFVYMHICTRVFTHVRVGKAKGNTRVTLGGVASPLERSLPPKLFPFTFPLQVWPRLHLARLPLLPKVTS